MKTTTRLLQIKLELKRAERDKETTPKVRSIIQKALDQLKEVLDAELAGVAS